MRNKIKTNLMLFTLVLVMMLSCGVTAYAQIASSPNIDTSTKSYYFNNELSSVVSPYSKYANWTTESTKYGKCATSDGSYWATEAIKYLLDNDIIRGVKDIKDGKSYIPSGNYIVGRDGLAITLFYHWADERADRKSTYSDPIKIFNSYDTTKILSQVNYTNGSGLTRKQAAAILATAIQIKSGGETKLSTYNSSGLGMYANGVKFASTDGYADANSLSMDGIYYQAFNLLMDLNVCQGRTVNKVTKLVPDELITYEEYYCWLLNLKDEIPPEKPVDTYTLTADLSMSATSATLNYKDFLEKSARGGYATLKATLDASKSVAKKNNSVIDIENYDYTISETKPNNVKGKDYTTGKMSNTVKFPKEYTYWVDTILAKDITSSTDKTKSKDQVDTDLRNNQGDYTYDITYNGSVTVYATLGDDGLKSKTATATTTGQVILENKAPVVDCEIYSTADVDEAYKRDFFYVGTPIKIKDYCWDKEDETPQTIEYLIEYYKNRDLTTVIESKNFDIEMKNSQYVSGVVADDDERYHKMTFKKSGYYKITITAIDEMRKQRMETFTIYVSGTPQPPIAKLIGPDYGYMNTNITFTDASTDPNDDIIKWEWPNVVNAEGAEVEYVEWFDEVLDEFDEGTGEGEWVIAKEDTDYEIVSIHAPHPVS